MEALPRGNTSESAVPRRVGIQMARRNMSDGGEGACRISMKTSGAILDTKMKRDTNQAHDAKTTDTRDAIEMVAIDIDRAKIVMEMRVVSEVDDLVEETTMTMSRLSSSKGEVL